MFTGIVQAVGRVAAVKDLGKDRRVTIAAGALLRGARKGDSIAVAGVCLTVTGKAAGRFTADVSAETLSATTAGGWTAGSMVNLEKALTPATPLGGHLVSGHVDGVGRLVASGAEGQSRRLRFAVPQPLARYIAAKGSVCIDGVSLTVNDVGRREFGVNIVPHTLRHTTLGRLHPGDPVNVEVDLIARYLERLIADRT